MSHASLSSLIWSVADLLRGDYKPADYGKVILPFTVLRRLDCVLTPSKAAVLAEKAAKEAIGLNPDPFLTALTGVPFANISPLTIKTLMGDQDHLAANLAAYIQGFSPAVRDVFERFRFAETTDRLQKARLLYQVTEKFAVFDLSPAVVSNHDMGLVFEELIRKFAEISNETAGEHFTPRDVIRLMVNLLFIEDSDILTPGGVLNHVRPGTERRELCHLQGRHAHQGADASALWQKMRKNLGSKRRQMGEADIAGVTRLFGDCVEAQLATITTADGRMSTVVVRDGEAD
jgi:type I restriction-modification system DNA methylase subunit